MRTISRVGAGLWLGLLVGCSPSTKGPADGGVTTAVDAGRTRESHRLLPPSPPPAPPPPPLKLAGGVTCQPYWSLVENGCDEKAIPPDATFCDPTHERLIRSSVLGTALPISEAELSELLAGVRWNDDPEGLLSMPNGALSWCKSFQSAQKQTLSRQKPSSLTGRSHFGDLQLLHGLASKPGEQNQQVSDRISIWLEFTYRVAAGEIAGETRLKDVPVKGLAAFFPQQSKRTVAELFQTPASGDVRARAMGSLLHVLQDLMGDGHTVMRVSELTGRELIDFHYTMAGVEHPHHRGDTGWRDAWPPEAPLSKWAPSELAVKRGIDLLRLAEFQKPWSQAQQYLANAVLYYNRMNTPAVAWGTQVLQEQHHH